MQTTIPTGPQSVSGAGISRLFHVINTTLTCVLDRRCRQRGRTQGGVVRNGLRRIAAIPTLVTTTSPVWRKRVVISLCTLHGHSFSVPGTPPQGSNSRPSSVFSGCCQRAPGCCAEIQTQYFGREAPVWEHHHARPKELGPGCQRTDQAGGSTCPTAVRTSTTSRCPKWCRRPLPLHNRVGRRGAVTLHCKSEDLGQCRAKGLYRLRRQHRFRRSQSGVTEPPVSQGGAGCTATITYPGTTRTGWLLYTSPRTTARHRAWTYAATPRHLLFRTRAPPINVQRIAATRRNRALSSHISSTSAAASIPPGQTPALPLAILPQRCRGLSAKVMG